MYYTYVHRKRHVLSFMIWNLLLKTWIYRYWTKSNHLDLPYPSKGRWEVSENVKYIAVTSRASKLPISKVRLLWDLNPGLPHEPLNIGKLAQVWVACSKPGEAELWRLVTLKLFKLQQCSLHFLKPPISLYLDYQGQNHCSMFSTHKFMF